MSFFKYSCSAIVLNAHHVCPCSSRSPHVFVCAYLLGQGFAEQSMAASLVLHPWPSVRVLRRPHQAQVLGHGASRTRDLGVGERYLRAHGAHPRTGREVGREERASVLFPFFGRQRPRRLFPGAAACCVLAAPRDVAGSMPRGRRIRGAPSTAWKRALLHYCFNHRSDSAVLMAFSPPLSFLRHFPICTRCCIKCESWKTRNTARLTGWPCASQSRLPLTTTRRVLALRMETVSKTRQLLRCVSTCVHKGSGLGYGLMGEVGYCV